MNPLVPYVGMVIPVTDIQEPTPPKRVDPMPTSIEACWKTKAGLQAAVMINGATGFRCGYVAVLYGHPLYGQDYSDPTNKLRFPRDETIGKRDIISLFSALGDRTQRRSPGIVFDVHGGLTYSDRGDNNKWLNATVIKGDPSKLWWFGFDAGHCDDGHLPEWIEAMHAKGIDLWSNRPARTLEYMVDECESLAQQIVDRVRWYNPILNAVEDLIAAFSKKTP